MLDEDTANAINVPLIGELLAPNSLLVEYVNSDQIGRPGFTKGVEYLALKYKHVRRVAGDGNCFYRAFLFAYLENLLEANRNGHTEAAELERLRMLNIIVNSKQFVISQGYSEYVFECFHDVRSHYYCVLTYVCHIC